MLILLQSFLFANPVVDLYRTEGIKAVQQYIQEQLQSKSYWEEALKNKDVSYGYYENLSSLLVANKKKKKLSVYNVQNGNLELLINYKDVIVGADGDKFKEGDLKTPLGVYEITRKFIPSDQFYGPLAFPLSYPNTYDKVQGKDGHGIWIHGSPLDGSPRDKQSKGCIVLDNSSIELLDKNIKPKKSITIVSEQDIHSVNVSEISTILSEFFQWKMAWQKNNLEKYLSFYSKDFKRFDGMRKRKFTAMKKTIFARNQKKDIVFKNINISPYPNNEGRNLFKIAFYEIYKTKRYKFRGNKELYIELHDANFTILSER